MTGNKQKNILIAAGGTGGHVFPGFAIAKALQTRGYHVTWMGTEKGIEAKVMYQAFAAKV
ncbi:MAG: glycosyltransferase [Gammaproteobacteria bacterium]